VDPSNTIVEEYLEGLAVGSNLRSGSLDSFPAPGAAVGNSLDFVL